MIIHVSKKIGVQVCHNILKTKKIFYYNITIKKKKLKYFHNDTYPGCFFLKDICGIL